MQWHHAIVNWSLQTCGGTRKGKGAPARTVAEMLR